MTGVPLPLHGLLSEFNGVSVPEVADAQRDALHPGQIIHHGRYVVHGVLGRGSCATVYDAEHLALGRRVALKVPLLQTEHLRSMHERFRREARLSAMVQHPNVLGIYDSGYLPEGTPFLVLEHVCGESLNQIFTRGPLPIPVVLELGRQLAHALSALADAGIVHRDIKPANVMLLRTKQDMPLIKVVDLGVAKRSAWHSSVKLTQQGELIGTPQYMATEQLRGEDVDGRADIYAVAAVLFEAVTGRPPHEHANFSDFLVAALGTPVRPARELRADCPQSLEAILQRALERDRERRHTTPTELLFDLEACKLELKFDQPVTYALIDVLGGGERAPTSEVRRCPPELTDSAADRAFSARAAVHAEWPLEVASKPYNVGDSLRKWSATGSRVASEHTLSILTGLLVLGAALWFVLPSRDETIDLSEARALPTPASTLPGAVSPESEAAELHDLPSDPSALPEPSDLGQPSAVLENPDDDDLKALARASSLQPTPSAPVRAPSHEMGSTAAVATQRAPQGRGPWVEEPRFVPKPPARLSVKSTLATQPQAPAALAPATPAFAAPLARGPARFDPPPVPATDEQGRHVFGKVSPPAGSTLVPTAQAGKPVEPPSSALPRALAAFVAGHFEEAKAGYIEVLRSQPNSPAALRGLGLAAARLAQNAIARESLSRYLQVAPSAPDAAAIEARIATLTP